MILYYKPGSWNEPVSITCLVIFQLIMYHGSILRSLIPKALFLLLLHYSGNAHLNHSSTE